MSKLELGTWAERLSEMVDEMKDSQSFETVKAKVAQIMRWWDLTGDFLEKNSTKLGDAVQKVLKATETENPFPEGMDMNWALDVQSAQTLNFFAGVQNGKVARKHLPENVDVVQAEIEAFLEKKAAEGAK